MSEPYWYKLVRKDAWIWKIQSNLQRKPVESRISLNDMKKAVVSFLLQAQREKFSEELDLLQQNKVLPKGNCLKKLGPFVDTAGLIRVKGRIGQGYLTLDQQQPVIISAKNHLDLLMVKEEQRICGNLGRETVLSSLQRKYWII